MRTRTIPSGATLLFGPDRPRPDLVLAAQFLVDDLRASGQRIGSLRVGDNLMRLRLDGLELALALSPGPLQPQAMAGTLRLPPDAEGAPELPEIGFTDLRAIRTMRLLRRHRHALGVLLRRRGLGTDDLDATLHAMLLAVNEAAPADLILWQRTGVLWSAQEFQLLAPSRLSEGGAPLRSLAPPPADAGDDGRSERLAVAANRPSAPGSRQDRTDRRSMGRLFDSDRPPAPLPRIEPATARLSDALRRPAEADAAPPATDRRRKVVTLVLAVWLLLGLWPVSGLQAMLP